MTKTRTFFVLGLVGISFAAALCSCLPSPCYAGASKVRLHRLPPAWWESVPRSSRQLQPSRTFKLPPAWWASVPEGCRPSEPPDTLELYVVGTCRVVDENGTDVDPIRIYESTPIRWVNNTDNYVSIHFLNGDGDYDTAIVGEYYIYLLKGESRVTTTKSGWPPEPNYHISVMCEGIQGPTPPIKECPPPPDPCP